MTTQWRPVVGYEGQYEVSDKGEVRSIGRWLTKRTRWGSVSQFWHAGRPLQWTDRGEGYHEVGLNRGGKQRQMKVHRLVLEAFVGPCPDGMEGCHANGNPADNRLENLRWDTHSSNVADSVEHGTHSKTRIARCPRRHTLTAPNLDPSQLASGRRSCWACRLARDDGRAARRRSASFDLDAAADQYHAALLLGWRPVPNNSKVRCDRGHELIAPNLRSANGRLGGCRACRAATSYIGSLRRRGHDVTHLDVAVLADEYYSQFVRGQGATS